MAVVITDITMLSERLSSLRFWSKVAATLYCTSFVSLCFIAKLHAQEKLTISAAANAEAVHQTVKSDNEGVLSYSSYTVSPNIYTSYDSKTFSGIWTAGLTYIDRENEISGDDTTYPNYSYTANWQAIENYLTLAATGTLSYQNTNAENYFLTDFLNNPQELAKTRSNRFTANLRFDNNDWVRGDGTIGYSDVASERSFDNNTALNNDSYSLQGRLSSGDRARYVLWTLSGGFQTTEQEDLDDNFVTRDIQFISDVKLIDSFSLRVSATHEGNQITNRTDSASFTRTYDTMGVGLTYRTALNRYISITGNKSRSSEENNDNESFIGLDIEWALSTRTSFSASYGKRFYGDSADVQFTYNTKSVRTTFSYNETVTNTSRLLANPENLGVFVCPIESTTIADCFQPNSLSYSPTAEEQLVQFTSQNIEFDDNIILRKSSNFQFGYSFSKVTTAFSWQYAEDEYIDVNRLRRSYSGTINLAYQLGRYTNLLLNGSYANIVERGEARLNSGVSENYNFDASINRTIGRHLSAAIKFTYLDKSGDLSNNSLFGEDYTDRRLSVVFTYKYE